jgi:hypothetical protein
MSEFPGPAWRLKTRMGPGVGGGRSSMRMRSRKRRTAARFIARSQLLMTE